MDCSKWSCKGTCNDINWPPTALCQLCDHLTGRAMTLRWSLPLITAHYPCKLTAITKRKLGNKTWETFIYTRYDRLWIISRSLRQKVSDIHNRAKAVIISYVSKDMKYRWLTLAMALLAKYHISDNNKFSTKHPTRRNIVYMVQTAECVLSHNIWCLLTTWIKSLF